MSEIKQWSEIQEKFSGGTLLLGNGASIAVVPDKFKYISLFEAANSHITADVKEIFDEFETHDFELVLKYLWQAKLVTEKLKVSFPEIDTAYNNVRAALIATIRDIHPPYNEIESHLVKIYEYMKQFKTVVSLNYDLIVYWAMLAGKKILGNWFKDCFIEGAFTYDIQLLRIPYKSEGTTLVFYPHGNLALSRTQDGERKIQCQEDDANLLKTITKQWENSDCTPLFVCEGETKHKNKAIEASPYLSFIYKAILPKLTESLVIYGWNLDNNDNHILAQFKDVKHVAVSVHNGNSLVIKHALDKLHDKEITFFDAASPGCWNNGWNNE